MKTQVIAVSSRIPREPYYRFDAFVNSLARLNVVPAILGMNQRWQGLMTKPNLYRQFLRAGQNSSDMVILCDCWDVVFTEHPDSISDRCIAEFGDTIVFNSEKGCWPRGDLAGSFPDTGTPWKFLNSGFICGSAVAILSCLEAMDIDSIGVDCVRPDGTKSEPNDQGEFQALWASRKTPMAIDSRCSLAQTLSACSMDEFDLSAERIVNKITGTTPGVFHFNGGSKNDMLPHFFNKWKL